MYIRTLVVMSIGLFTSRVTLDVLGVENYGVYCVVGGFVALFTIVGGTLVTACQRFLTIEIGRRDCANPQKVFNVSVLIHIVLAIFLLILFETFGLWFVLNKLNIPAGCIGDIQWVFQCSVFSFLINIICAPYNALLIAYEKISAFAYINLFDAVAKLGIVYALYCFSSNHLVWYSILLLIVAIVDRIVYSVYCYVKFPDFKFKLEHDFVLLKEILHFAGFTFVGSTASVLCNQGINVLMNLFGNVTANAARAIAVQVQNATMKFVNDFMTALNPQITKSYAAGNVEKSMKLCFCGARISYFMMYLIAIPFLFKTQCILDLWLKNYPKIAISFVQMTLLLSLVAVLSNPIVTEILAIGKLKMNALIIGLVRIMTIPICYFFLSLKYDLIVCYLVLLVIEVVSLFVRLLVLKFLNGFEILGYVRNVLCRVLLVSICSLPCIKLFDSMTPSSFKGILLFVIAVIPITFFIECLLGLTKSEKKYVIVFLRKKIICK